jgi:hypothetical protein
MKIKRYLSFLAVIVSISIHHASLWVSGKRLSPLLSPNQTGFLQPERDARLVTDRPGERRTMTNQPICRDLPAKMDSSFSLDTPLDAHLGSKYIKSPRRQI